MLTEGKYILDENGNPKPEPDLMVWAEWFEKSQEKRRVALTKIGDKEVSTVFLGMDHSFGRGSLLLYETMVFGDEDGIQERYSTKEEALAGHDKIVKQYDSNSKPKDE